MKEKPEHAGLRGEYLPERLMDEKNFRYSSVVAAVFIMGFGVVYYLYGLERVLAFSVIFLALCIAVNLYLYRFHRHLGVASSVFVVLTLLAFQVGILYGGIDGYGLYFVFGLPAAVFVFAGTRRGIWFNGFMVFFVFALLMIRVFGLADTRYSTSHYLQTCVGYVAFFIVGYLAQKNRETLQLQLTRHRQQLSIILETMPAGVVVFETADGGVSTSNKQAETIFGRSTIGTSRMDDFIRLNGLSREDGTPYPIENFPPAVAVRQDAVVVRNDIFVSRPDGSKSVLRVASAPIHDHLGQVIAVVAVIQDMTKEYDVDKMKSEFVSLVSHQFKTPLTAIKWSAESLRHGSAGGPSPDQVELIDMILTTVGGLNRLVDDLLNVSRIETGRKFNLVQKPTDVVPLLADLTREISPSAGQRRVTIVMPVVAEPLMLNVDGGKFKEVFRNLISNAVKYSGHDGHDGHVEIGWTRSPADGGTLFVKDNGIGIPKDQQSKMFERFFRADNAPQETEGTGLGLYIARAIVEKHGGRIWFESETGKGTAFYVNLPSA